MSAAVQLPDRRVSAPLCGSAGHMQPPNVRSYKTRNGRSRKVCRLCDQARRKSRRVAYDAQGYPL